MNELSIYEAAIGDCIVCGEDATGSLYWTPLPDDVWAIVRPSVASLFHEGMVQNVLFLPGDENTPLSESFCGAACATKHKEMNNGTTP